MRCSRPTAALLTLLLALPAAVRAQAPPPPAQPAPPARPEEAPQPAFKISGLVCGDYYDVAQSRRDDLEAYADWQDRPDRRDVSTLEAFAGWQEKSWRASIQHGHQDRREAGPGGSDLALDFLSAFAAVQVTPRVAVLGRVDRSFDPIPGGETTDYMPFSEQAKSVFGHAGVDVTLTKSVHLVPNVEWTVYGEAPDGTTPGTDVVPRLTLFFSW